MRDIRDEQATGMQEMPIREKLLQIEKMLAETEGTLYTTIDSITGNTRGKNGDAKEERCLVDTICNINDLACSCMELAHMMQALI